jgi:CCR4-NOT transcriptional complex subunit CAF120
MNVITLNTAGANLLLFACPDTYSLISWASALRLSGYEKARLEEIYTAHILRLSFNAEGSWKEPATRLIRGKLEGQVKVRVAGKTEWRPVWAVVSAASTGGGGSRIGVSEDSRPQSPPNSGSVSKRVSALFNRNSTASDASVQSQAPQTASITFYLSQKGKDRKKPLLTIRNVSQAFAVYPERPELINHSTLIKVEGLIGDEDTAGALKSREGWIYIVPEMVEPGRSGLKEMLKWITGGFYYFQPRVTFLSSSW